MNLALSIAIGSIVTPSFRNSITAANNNITSLGKKVKDLNSIQIDIKGFRDLSKNILKNKEKLKLSASELIDSGVDITKLAKEFTKKIPKESLIVRFKGLFTPPPLDEIRDKMKALSNI